VVVLAVVLFVILKATRPEAVVATVEETRFSVRTMTAEPGFLHPELSLIAEIGSAAQPTLTAALAADVLYVHAREGQRIPRGELLIELDERDAEVQLSQARADLAQAEANLRLEQEQVRANRDNLAREQELARLSEAELARLVRLRDKGLVSETDLNQAKQNHQKVLLSLAAREQAVALAPARAQQAVARVRAAEASIQSAELQLQRTSIVAPFDAVITRIHVEQGSRVSPGSALVSLYDAGNIEFVVDVPTRHLGALQRSLNDGDLTTGRIKFGGETLPVRLLRLGGESRGGAVQAWFGQDGPVALPTGIRVPLLLRLPAVDHAIALPESGLYDLSKVFRVVDGRLQSLVVTVHGRQDEDVVISHPELQSGDVFLVTHLANASTGLAINELR